VAGGARKRNVWTSCTNPGKNEIYRILSSIRAFDWYMYGSDPRKRGVGGPSFFGGVQNISGHFYGISIASSES